MEIVYRPIGYVHSPFKRLEEMPIQPSSRASAPGTVEILPEYAEALQDLEGFSHIILLYHFHRVTRQKLKVTPFMDSVERGIFATRAPTRPNPLGLSVVELMRIEGNRLHLRNVDILDGTPVIDIKPYIPEFDHPEKVRIGWLRDVHNRLHATRSDDRFR